MKKNIKLLMLLIIAVFTLSIIAACSSSSEPSDTPEKEENNNGKEEQEQKKEPEEVNLIWAYQGNEEQYQADVGRFIEEKFPYVKVEVYDAGTDHPETLEELIAKGKTPDIVTMGAITHTSHLATYELDYDISNLIEQTSFDLERFEPSFIEFARNQDPDQEGRLVVFPMTRPTYSLHYNKDVFDILGAEYPTDGMTWEEVVELAKDLTREVNGVQYRGLDLDTPYDAYTQFSQNSIDPETNDVLITQSEAYRRYLGLIGEVTSIPGNYPEENPGDLLHNWGAEFDKENVAMTAIGTNFGWLEKDNIDIVTYPVWEGYEGIGPQPRGRGHAITAPSENKEIALEIIDYLLSDEVQIIKSKEGVASPLKSQEINDVYNADNPQFNDKNLASLFIHGYATGAPKRSKYGDGVITMAGINYVNSGKELNEYLRILQEEAEENVRSQMESE
ncbi:ABC transporter substrate-binding protein [Bacillus niameyensis]|uniref:ABC transporter substrate-binding protein n=1 Tax=Bacillus niameyensis TaxID=1522308 RepID=UPI000783A7A6|nr:extracellular solute-binding protein [Bacillus niameyensis]